jgi:microcystin-dependent protein
MSSPFIAEIRAFGFNYAPVNWAFCNGQPMAISQNDALYAIIGTIYGGDGVTTFNLPNLQGQIPMHWGNGPGGFTTQIGQVQGTTSVTLTIAQTPQHTHVATMQQLPPGGVVEETAVPSPTTWLSDSVPGGVWTNVPPTLDANFSGSAITPVGGSQPHDNMQPYLAVNFCICLFGIFPSRN